MNLWRQYLQKCSLKLSARECRICGTSCYYQSRAESRICGLIRCSLRHFFFSCCLHKLRIARNMLHNRQIQSFSRLVWLAVFASCLHMKRTAVSKNSNIKFLRCCFRPFASLSFSVSPPLFVTFPLVTPFWLISMIQRCVSRLLSLILFVLPLFHPALFLSPFLSLPPFSFSPLEFFSSTPLPSQFPMHVNWSLIIESFCSLEETVSVDRLR